MRQSTLFVALIVLSFGCSERHAATDTDWGVPIDARVDDGGASLDAASMPVDAASMPVDAASMPVDAASSDGAVLDAGHAGDGGALTAESVCAGLCPALSVCAGSTPSATCTADCSADLADCSAAQLESLAACNTAGCAMGAMAPAIVECLTMVACIGTGAPPPPPTPVPMPGS